MIQRHARWVAPLLLAIIGAAVGFLIFSLPLTKAALGAPSPADPQASRERIGPYGLADLKIDQSGPENTLPGETVIYTIRVTNTSGASISNVVLTDTWTTRIPQDAMWDRGILALYNGNYVSTPPGAVANFTYTLKPEDHRGEAFWNLNPIAAGQHVEIVFTVTTPITLQPTLREDSIWGRVGPSDLENSVVAGLPGEGNVEAPLVTSLVVGPLLRVEQSTVGEVAPENNCRVGRLITYTFHVQNLDLEGTLQRPDAWAAVNLVVGAPLPEQLRSSYLTTTSSVSGVIWDYNAATGAMTWTFPMTFVLMPAADTYITLTARVPADTSYNPKAYLQISKKYFWARADTMLRTTSGYNSSKVRILSPFDKVVATGSPPTKPDYTYPNRVITYTLTFYNPLQESLTAMVLEDTLFDTFSYQGTIAGPAPTWSGENQMRWDSLNVQANGEISTIFEVFVDPQTIPNSCSVKHYNAVTATNALFYEGNYIGHDNNRLAQVVVDRQLRLSKTVQPSLQFAGEEVTYTIRLQNVGDTDIAGPIILTDTLPALFTFSAMVSSPPGDPQVSGNILRWDDIPSVAAGDEFVFSFRVIVDGASNTTYRNDLFAYTEDTSICPLLQKAGVKIDLPFRLNKIASTAVITQGDTFSYEAEIFNISPRHTYSVTLFGDLLPDGFIDVTDDDGIYMQTVDPPAVMPPGGTWSTGWFDVLVRGEGVGTDWCELRQLPGKDVPQLKGYIVFFVTPDYEAGLSNRDSLATVEVIPHVYLLQEAYPNPVAVNETQILTLTLHDNRTNPITDITGVNLHWEIPIDGEETFTFISSTPPPTTQSYPDYTWDNLTIPAGGETHVVLTLQAAVPLNKDMKRAYYSKAEVTSLDDMSICIPSSHKYKLQVRRGIEIDKIAKPDQVGPYGIVEYTLRVSNLTGAPVSNVVITDVLPSNWEYVSLSSGPSPISTSPLVWEFASIPAEDRVEIKFKARAYIFLGLRYNQVEGEAPINLGYSSAYTDHVEVEIVSGVGFYKTVNPDDIAAGESTVYTITLFNGGASEHLQDIVITDTLPISFTFAAMLHGPAPQQDGNRLVWQIPDQLDKGKTLELSFRVNTSDMLPSGTYYNQVVAQANSVQSGEPVVIPATGETAPVTIHGVPTVQVTKRVTPEEVRAGGDVTYTVTLFNEAEHPYTLVVTDTLPYSLTFAEALSPTVVTVVPGPRERIVWSDLDIDPQQTLTLTFRAHVDRLALDGFYCNDLHVKMGTFILPHYGLACLNVLQIPRVDAQVSKDDGVSQVEEGQTLTYTIHYTNAATSEASLHNVVLTETITPLDYLTVLGGPGWNDIGAGRYRLEVVGPLAPGEAGTVTFTVRLTATVPATAVLAVINQVEVGYTTLEKTIEGYPADNVAQDVDVWQGADLVITGVRWEPEHPEPGEPMQVYVMVENQGSDPVNQRYDGSTDPGYWLFVMELYLKGTAFTPVGLPVNVFDHQGGYCADATCALKRNEYLAWPNTLEAGESQEMVFNIITPDPDQYHLYAQADVTWEGWYGGKPFGLILEAIENNNIFEGPILTLGTIPHEIYLPLVLRNQ